MLKSSALQLVQIKSVDVFFLHLLQIFGFFSSVVLPMEVSDVDNDLLRVSVLNCCEKMNCFR